MHGTHIIEVFHKEGVKDPTCIGLQLDVRHLGIKSVKEVRSSQLYRLVGDSAPKDRTRIAQDLLVDHVVQDYRDGMVNMTEKKKQGPTSFIVDVWYKAGVTDVVGESVLKGIRDLNVSSISEVRTGMRYRWMGLPNVQTAEKIANTLLVNSLVHDSFIHAD